MARKRSVWTKAMRKAAAERGRYGDREAKRRGGQLGGRMSWYGKTPEEQAVVLERLAAHRGKQTNTSPKARRAQAERARAQGKTRRGGSSKQAAFLANAGMLKRGPYVPSPKVPIVAPKPIAAPVLPFSEPLPDRKAFPEGLPGLRPWQEAVWAWQKRKDSGKVA